MRSLAFFLLLIIFTRVDGVGQVGLFQVEIECFCVKERRGDFYRCGVCAGRRRWLEFEEALPMRASLARLMLFGNAFGEWRFGRAGRFYIRLAGSYGGL